MRRVLFTAMAVLIGIGLAGTAEAQNNIIRFTAVLSGANETPAPGVLTGAFANATVTLDTSTQTVSWNIDVFNMPSGTNNAHFHVGGPGLAGPTVVNVASRPAFPTTTTCRARRPLPTCWCARIRAFAPGRTSSRRWWADRPT